MNFSFKLKADCVTMLLSAFRLVLTLWGCCLFLGQLKGQTVSARQWYQKGETAIEKGEKDSAEAFFAKAAALYATEKNWNKYLDAAAEQAGAVFLQLRYAEAEKMLSHLQNELKAKVDQNFYGRWKLHYFKGQCYIYLGESEKAGKELALAREFLKSSSQRHKADRAKVLQKSGVHYLYGGENTFLATDFLEEALSLQLALNQQDEKSLATTYQFLGKAYFDNYEFERAARSLEKALLLREKKFGKNSYYAASSHDKLGNCLSSLGRNREALNHYKKAYNFFEQDTSGTGKSLYGTPNNIATAYLNLGDFDNALLWYQRALKINQALFDNNPQYLWAPYLNLAITYQKKKDFAEARKWYQKALAYSQQLLGELSTESAQVFQELASFYKEQGFFMASQQAIETSVRILGGSSHSEQSYEQIESLEHTSLLIESFLFWGKLLKQEYQYKPDSRFLLEQSIQKLNQAVLLLEHASSLAGSYEDRLFLNRDKSELFAEGISAALELSDSDPAKSTEMAFRFMERSRANALLSSVSRARARYLSGLPEELVEKEDSLKTLYYRDRLLASKWKGDTLFHDSLIRLEQEISRHEIAIGRLEQEFKEDHPAFLRLARQDSMITLSQLQQNLIPENGTWIEYFWHEDFLAVIKITEDTAQLRVEKVPLGFDSLFNSYITMLRNPRLSKKELFGFAEKGHRIYSFLIGPELQGLKTGKNQSLCIIPDGKLAFLPFETLLSQAPNNKKKSYRELPYLLKSFEISYNSSASVLKELKNLPQSIENGKVLGFSWSDQSKVSSQLSKLSPLPGTFKEVNALKKRIEGDYLFGSNASESQFKQKVQAFSILHLAIHGKADDQSEPALFFRSERDSLEDGTLYLSELYALRIPAALAVLSACESGAGKLQEREGVMNLSRGFHVAGCPAVIQTLWELDDQSSQQLIKSMYHSLQDGKTKSQALREAKLAYLEGAPNSRQAPFFWAPFIFSGDDASITIATKKPQIDKNLMLIGLIFLLMTTLFSIISLKLQRRS